MTEAPVNRMSNEELLAFWWRLHEYRRFFEATIDVDATIAGVESLMAVRELETGGWFLTGKMQNPDD